MATKRMEVVSLIGRSSQRQLRGDSITSTTYCELVVFRPKLIMDARIPKSKQKQHDNLLVFGRYSLGRAAVTFDL